MESPQEWRPFETETGIYVQLPGGDLMPVHDMEEGYALIEFLTTDLEKNASSINNRNHTKDTGSKPITDDRQY